MKTRLHCLFSLLGFLLTIHCFAEAPILRVGIFSDTQSYADEQNRGTIATRQVLEKLRDAKVDLLLYGGDVSDNGKAEVYRNYRKIVADVFGDAAPPEIVIMGNHDFWNDMTPEDAKKNFCDNIGQTSVNTVVQLKGYTFIGISPEDGALAGTYTDAISGAFLDAAATQVPPGKPFFVLTHQNPKDTVYGSDDWGNADLARMFSRYPNLVSFSGHSHYALEDERSISQGQFTAVQTQSLSYIEMEAGKCNGSIPPAAWSVARYLLLDIYEDRLEIRRFDLERPEEICQSKRWTLPRPLEQATFRYTNKQRVEQSTPPCFSPTAQAEVSFPEVPYRFAQLTLDAAHHDNFVHSYAVTLETSGEEPQELLFFSDFYKAVDQMQPRLTLDIPAQYLSCSKDYHATIRAIESFGKRSAESLTVEFSTPAKRILPAKKQ